MMSMFTKTTSSMARTHRSIVSQEYVAAASDEDLSAWEIVDFSLSDDDGVCSFDGDDSMSDGASVSLDLVPLESDDDEGDGGVISYAPELNVEEGSCISRVVSLVIPEVDRHELECGDGYGNECAGDDDEEEEGAWESRELVSVVSDDDGLTDACDSRDCVTPQVVSVVVPVVELVDEIVYGHAHGYGNEEDVDDYLEEDDLYDEDDDVDDDLMPWKFRGRFGKNRIKKIGKKGGSKIEKKKRMPYFYNRPGCLSKKAQHAYL